MTQVFSGRLFVEFGWRKAIHHVLHGAGKSTLYMDVGCSRALLLSMSVLWFAAIGCTVRQSLNPALGRWEGFATMGERRMELSIDILMNDQTPEARITVPRERVLGKRAPNLDISLPEIRFSIPVTGNQAPFHGRIAGGSLIGSVSLGQRSMNVELRRTGDVPAPPYREEQIEFANAGIKLTGSLLIPEGNGRHPAVVLIHGSSTPDRDDFRFYADLFVRRGIAALIYDKRTYTGEGGMSQVDLRDLAKDAAAAVVALRSRTDIDPTRIGLWGHSQGGWVVPMVAADLDSIAFAVGFSAPGVSYADLDKFANATRLRLNGFAQAEIDQALTALRQVDAFVRGGGDRLELQSALDSFHRTRWASFTTLPRLAPTAADIQSWLRWRNLDLDPVDYWRVVRTPVLLVYGELDDVVPVDTSAARIRDALRQAGNTNVVLRIFPKQDHTISGADDFPEFMAAWMVEQTRRKRSTR
jgi:pimeloyl-ACP methyl ester carboxylesterase